MAALSPAQIVAAIEDAFTETGASAALISEQRMHPRRFYVVVGDLSFPVWVYIWTLTHGCGAARPRDEYRIQLTSVTPPLPQNPDGPTLLLGYDPGTKCFAGFDLRRHKNFSLKSPSIQIDINALRGAVRDGFTFARKGNDEIAIGFRPDNILAYALNADALHESGADAHVSELLGKVARFETLTEDDVAACRRNGVASLPKYRGWHGIAISAARSPWRMTVNAQLPVCRCALSRRRTFFLSGPKAAPME